MVERRGQVDADVGTRMAMLMLMAVVVVEEEGRIPWGHSQRMGVGMRPCDCTGRENVHADAGAGAGAGADAPTQAKRPSVRVVSPSVQSWATSGASPSHDRQLRSQRYNSPHHSPKNYQCH